MSKLIILTASIIRGDFHTKTIGKFYKYFDKYLKNYEIYHIINIDEPIGLKKYFNKYETMYIYNEIIPKEVNTVFINEPNPGFLNAYKKLISKVESLNLVNKDYFYYWLEDDWEPKTSYNIHFFLDTFNFENTAYTFSSNCPLGSFRGGPFMNGTYFINVFNIKKYMNNTCDPERQMQRWIRGGNNKNGNEYIYRFSVKEKNIELLNIHLIFVSPKKTEFNLKKEIGKFSIYKSFTYDKSIKFHNHIIIYDKDFNLKYSYINNNKYNLKNINKSELNTIFNNLSIKYVIIQPVIFNDEMLGRRFNEKYNLKKWVNIGDGTSYSFIRFYNAQLGNWKLLDEDTLRLKADITMNKGFFSSLAYIHQCLPYLEKHYFSKNINLNILYYSHNYGQYPNFQVIGDILQLNYKPSLNKDGKQFDELTCFGDLYRKICGTQKKDNNTSLYQSYMDDFNLANQYFFKYLKFEQSINAEVDIFTKKFKNEKVLGLHYRGTDKNKANWVTHISIDEFTKIISYQLKKKHYDVIFISTDDSNFIKKIQKIYGQSYKIYFYDTQKNEQNSKSIHLNCLSLMENQISKIKKNKDNLDKLILLENDLKKKTQKNRLLLKNVIISSILLSKCDCVLKTHSQVSAYSKIFNPNLEIYRVNACQEGYWPDSHIPLYEYQGIEDIELKNLLQEKLKNEFSKEKKFEYINF